MTDYLTEALLPRLFALRADLRAAGREPVGVVLPERMKPSSETDAPTQIMDMSVTWGEVAGLVYEA